MFSTPLAQNTAFTSPKHATYNTIMHSISSNLSICSPLVSPSENDLLSALFSVLSLSRITSSRGGGSHWTRSCPPAPVSCSPPTSGERLGERALMCSWAVACLQPWILFITLVRVVYLSHLILFNIQICGDCWSLVRKFWNQSELMILYDWLIKIVGCIINNIYNIFLPMTVICSYFSVISKLDDVISHL